MDPVDAFNNQMDLFIKNSEYPVKWNFKKDSKNNIIIIRPPEWVLHSIYNGVSIQCSLSVKGEMVLSITIENPISLEYRVDFKKDLYKLLKERNLLDTSFVGYEPNFNRRGKFLKRAFPLLSDSYQELMKLCDSVAEIGGDVASLIHSYKSQGKVIDPSILIGSTRSNNDSQEVEVEHIEEVQFDDGDNDYHFEYDETRKIFTQKSEPTVENLHKQSKRGKLNLQPDFQRQFVWDRNKATSLIESILLDVPLPIVYLAEIENGSLEVIDGQQRLSSIFSFIDFIFPDGKPFKLTNPKILKNLHQKSFSEIPESLQDKLESASISVITVKKESDPELKFEIFERLNTGSVKLNDQELRNCLFRGEYSDLLRRLSQDKDFMYIMGLKRPDSRMKDVEFVLHFGAFFHQTYLKCTNGMKEFLNKEMKTFRNLNSEQVAELENNFKKAVQINKTLFGNRSFKRIKRGDSNDMNSTWKNTSVVNAALYDLMMTFFLTYDKNMIHRNLDAIREAIIYLMTENQEFVDAIEKWTNSSSQVRKRFEIFQSTMETIFKSDSPQARCFSYQLKENLFRLNSTCAICGQRIYMIEDAAVDHVEQYWLGGQTIADNARLTHRFCNASRKRKEMRSE